MGFWTKAIGFALGGIPGLIIAAVIDEIISAATIRKQVREDDGFYAQIQELQPTTVTIDEIDEDGDVFKQRRMESSDGVDDDLYEGQRIYAYE